jgi:hypothetical protein
MLPIAPLFIDDNDDGDDGVLRLLIPITRSLDASHDGAANRGGTANIDADGRSNNDESPNVEKPIAPTAVLC